MGNVRQKLSIIGRSYLPEGDIDPRCERLLCVPRDRVFLDVIPRSEQIYRLLRGDARSVIVNF